MLCCNYSSVLILLLLRLCPAQTLQEGKCAVEPLHLEYPSCPVPEPVLAPPSTTSLQEQLQATATSHEGKFLSFEEWKAQNLQEQAHPQASQSTMSASSKHNASPTYLANPTQVINSADVEAFEVENTSTRQTMQSEHARPSKSDQDSRAIPKKERFNHASFDCAASIIQANKESKGSSNILKENKDYYMLNTCGAENKFVTIELCNDILVDTVQLANYEFFSGVFKDVKILVAAKYPPGREGWQELGKFRARQARDVQTFHFENPLMWTRYVRIEMLSFYGNEFYCPLSLVRVFGKTMMEDYKQEGNAEAEEGPELALPAQDLASQEMLTDIERAAEGLVAMSDQLADNMQKHDYVLQEPATVVAVEILEPTTTTTDNPSATDSVESTVLYPSTSTVCLPTVTNLPLAYPMEFSINSSIVTSVVVEQVGPHDSLTNATTKKDTYNRTSLQGPSQFNRTALSSSTLNETSRHNTSDTPIESKPSKSAPSAHPSTQESIYKQMAKRISLLEANATLSLRYIESQSSLLAQSFSHLSSTQARHLANFLENVNVTMLQRISHLKQEYEQLYLDASKSITASRHRQEVDMSALTRKIGALSDDITFFKRLGIFQSVLMLVLFGFLVTSRHAGIDLQNSLHRALNPRSPLGSPIMRVGSPMSWRHHFRSQSSAGPASIYSFPVDQIDRPERARTHHDASSDHDNYEAEGNPIYTPKHSNNFGAEHMPRTGLGINLARKEERSFTDPLVRNRIKNLSLDSQGTNLTKDDADDHDPHGSVLVNGQSSPLCRESSGGQNHSESEVVGHDDQASEQRPSLRIDTGAEDYPTPRPEPEEAE